MDENLLRTFLEEPTPAKEIKTSKKKLLGKGALVLAAGWASSAVWGGAIALNRILEKNDIDTTLPAIGMTAASTAMEFGATYLGTAGELDVSWEPKRRATVWLKKHLGKLPLLVTSWRGAAGGAALDQLAGREITAGRRLAHAATYGSIIGAYVSEPGSRLIEAVTDAGEYALRNPVSGAIGVVALGASLLHGMRLAPQNAASQTESV